MVVRSRLHSSVAPSGASLSPEGDWSGRLLPKRHVFQGPNKNCLGFLIPPGWWKAPIFQDMGLVAPDDMKIWICNSELGNLVASGMKL